MPQMNLALQLVPLVNQTQAYPLVDEAIALIATSGLAYEVTPFNTVVEGDLQDLQALVAGLHGLMADRLDLGQEWLLNCQWHAAAGKALSFSAKTAGQPSFKPAAH